MERVSEAVWIGGDLFRRIGKNLYRNGCWCGSCSKKPKAHTARYLWHWFRRNTGVTPTRAQMLVLLPWPKTIDKLFLKFAAERLSS